MGRWLTVRFTAWALRKGLDEGTVLNEMRRSHPKQTDRWRLDVIDSARAKNARKAGHAPAGR